MIRKSVSDLKGGEVLAKAVVWDHQVLLDEGTVIKKEYIRILRDLGILNVNIKDESVLEENKEQLVWYDRCEGMIRDVTEVLSRHMYIHDQDRLKILQKIADDVIDVYETNQQFTLKEEYLEARNTNIYEHSFSVCCLSVAVALKLNLDKEFIRALALGCLLHDIGLRCLESDFIQMDFQNMPEHIIKEFHKHPVYGYSLFMKVNWLPEVAGDVILHHHERLDGSGYPMKIKELTMESKIVAVCDTFDEMICGIACQKKSVPEAVNYLLENKGILFDSEIVDLFTGFIELADRKETLRIS